MAASDVLHNNVKEKLARGEVVASMTVRLSRSLEIARIAKTAGFDMLYIDLEHSPLTMDAAGQIAWPASTSASCLRCGCRPTRPTIHLQYRPFPAAETAKAINDATMVIVQFESAGSLAEADEIVAVEGVDVASTASVSFRRVAARISAWRRPTRSQRCTPA